VAKAVAFSPVGNGEATTAALPSAVPGFICGCGGGRWDMGAPALGLQGEWWILGPVISVDADGYLAYHGRGDDMLKARASSLPRRRSRTAPSNIPRCASRRWWACPMRTARSSRIRSSSRCGEIPGWGDELKAFVRDRLEPYKHPREVRSLAQLPRTHLGKVDRGRLRGGR
jgi:acyl-coenzyme A synthetase/AMP-(fatty) acid ligase